LHAAAARGKKFRVAAETQSGVIDDPLVDRPGDQGVEATGQAAVTGLGEGP
jgi:hypothetical protein